jgi:hypothetical protein
MNTTRPPFAELEPGEAFAEVAEVIDLPADAGSLDFLQAVYRDAGQPLPVRMRAAIAALPFERPKLAVIANVSSFAGRMEELARLAGRSNVIDATPIPKTLAPNSTGDQ